MIVHPRRRFCTPPVVETNLRRMIQVALSATDAGFGVLMVQSLAEGLADRAVTPVRPTPQVALSPGGGCDMALCRRNSDSRC